MHPTPVQALLFQKIKEQTNDQPGLAETIASLLHVSTDSAYRRMRGETPLILEEAKTLCAHYHISLDEIFGHKTGRDLTFTLFPAITPQRDFNDFLKDIKQQLQLFLSAGDCTIYYLTKDIPIFHQFTYQPLFAFRYFFWMKTILQHPDFVKQQFAFNCLPDSTRALGREIQQLYNEIPSVEIWNAECINSVLLQLEFYRQAGLFASDQDMALVYDALGKTITHLGEQASQGSKFLPEEKGGLKKDHFQFYSNRLILGDNTILVSCPHQKMAFINHDVLDYMVTTDTQFCNETLLKMRTLIKRSTLISKVSEKQRAQFFGLMLEKWNRSKAAALSNPIAG